MGARKISLYGTGRNETEVIEYLCSLVEDRDEPVNFLQLYLTQRCQLACKYCGMRGSSERSDMSESMLRQAIDFLFTSDSKDIRLQFFGGEPLLRFDLVKKGVSYALKKAERLGKKCKFLLATNGLSLNKASLDFFRSNNFSLVFSLDGKEKVQAINRPPLKRAFAERYFKQISTNLERLAASGVSFFVNCVVGPGMVSYMPETVDFLINRKVRNIRFSYMMGVFWEMPEIRRLQEEVREQFVRCKNDHPEIEITACDDEPVLLCSGIAAAHNGDLFVGSTLPLKQRFTHLPRINYYGNLNRLKTINLLKRNKKAEVEKALGAALCHKNEFRLLANNIYMGILHERLFNRLLKNHDKS